MGVPELGAGRLGIPIGPPGTYALGQVVPLSQPAVPCRCHVPGFIHSQGNHRALLYASSMPAPWWAGHSDPCRLWLVDVIVRG